MLPNLKKWSFFYFSPGFSPETHTTRLLNDDGSCMFITVVFDPSAKQDQSIEACALELVKEGVQTIELCGGFGPEWVSRVAHAVGPEIPVGTVFYGPEYRSALLRIMAPYDSI